MLKLALERFPFVSQVTNGCLVLLKQLYDTKMFHRKRFDRFVEEMKQNKYSPHF